MALADKALAESRGERNEQISESADQLAVDTDESAGGAHEILCLGRVFGGPALGASIDCFLGQKRALLGRRIDMPCGSFRTGDDGAGGADEFLILPILGMAFDQSRGASCESSEPDAQRGGIACADVLPEIDVFRRQGSGERLDVIQLTARQDLSPLLGVRAPQRKLLVKP